MSGGVIEVHVGGASSPLQYDYVAPSACTSDWFVVAGRAGATGWPGDRASCGALFSAPDGPGRAVQPLEAMAAGAGARVVTLGLDSVSGVCGGPGHVWRHCVSVGGTRLPRGWLVLGVLTSQRTTHGSVEMGVCVRRGTC